MKTAKHNKGQHNRLAKNRQAGRTTRCFVRLCGKRYKQKDGESV